MSRTPLRPCSVYSRRRLTKVSERKNYFETMRRFALILFTFLALASTSSFGLDWSSLVWIGGRQAEVEKPEVVEVVRWRQPVCVIPAKGVRSCLRSLSNLRKEYERTSGDEFVEERKKIEELTSKERRSKLYDDLLLNDEEASDLRSTHELFEQLRPSEEDLVFREDKDNVIAKRTVSLPQKIVQDNPREAKYLTVTSEKPNLIYVTKVLKAPVTATLVALHCLPDIGVPLCEDERALKNAPIFEDESKESEEMDPGKLLEMLAKQESVVNVIRRMIEKSGGSRNAEGKPTDVLSSDTSNLNVAEDTKLLEGLELAEILLEKDNDDSEGSDREKRHAKPILFQKYGNIFSEPTNEQPVVISKPVYVVESPVQHPWWEMIQKRYNAWKKPIYVYQKPFNHTSILEWLFPKKPIAKLDFFQNIFRYIHDKKFPSSSNDPFPLTNEKSESQMSSEKPMNPEDPTTTTTTTKPVDDTTIGNGSN